MKVPIDKLARIRQRLGAWRWYALGAAAVVLLLVWWRGGGGTNEAQATFAVRRGPLEVTVLEGGNIEALESQAIKCEVRVGFQGIKIIKIVEEGYQVTAEDIRTNKVLVELDSSEIENQIVQQDIAYEQASATLTETKQAYEIQLNQNLSDIKAAEQKVRFARMDFEKFLGDQAVREIIGKLGLEEQLAAQETNATARASAITATIAESRPGPASPAAVVTAHGQPVSVEAIQAAPMADPHPAGPSAPPPAATGSTNPPSPAALDLPLAMPTTGPVDFSAYAKLEVLGDGEAKQKIRKFDDDLQVARKELEQAQATLDGTKRLFEKGFVTKTDMQRDEIAFENSRLKVQTAQTARDLFLKYEFPKTAEEFLSKYDEAVRELTRARKAAVSKLAQAEAKLKSAQAQFNIQKRRRQEMHEQLDKCTITATKPGLVVYGGGQDMRYFGGEEPIRAGATVRQQQTIITIPDLTRMAVKVKIHESYIKRVKQGQQARITIEAFPDEVLEGEVAKVGVLPDSQDRWMNPDMKVYLTTIHIDGTHDWLKPGMSAKVEILVNRLDDVLYVPMQAVSSFEGKRVCYVTDGGHPERRFVETGEFNDAFIEIKSGLKENELVLLAPSGPAAETTPGGEAPAPEPATPSTKPAVVPAAGQPKA